MLQLSLDNKKFKTKPTPTDAAVITTKIANKAVNISFNEFVNALGSGQSWCPGLFKDGIRKSAKWTGQQTFVADIDNHNLQFDDIITMCNCFDLPLAVAHESFSSTEDNRKWRLIFLSDKLITDCSIAIGILRKIQQHFESDTCVIDLARLLYSCYNRVRFHEEVYFDPGQLDLEQYLVSQRKNSEKTTLPDISKNKNKKYEILSNAAARSVRLSKDSRYMTLWHNTRKLAQSGIFSESDIRAVILRAVERSGGKFDDYDKDIDKIIQDAIEWGSRHQWED